MKIITAVLLYLLSLPMMAESSVYYDYADGNGNVYHLTPSSLVYQPISANQSSSGVYSGGMAVQKTLTAKDYQTLLTKLQAAIINKKIQIKQRLMGSGMIVIHQHQQKTTLFLQQNAKEKLALEDVLNTLKQP